MRQRPAKNEVHWLLLGGLVTTLMAVISVSQIKLSPAAANDSRRVVAAADDFAAVETRVNRFLEEHQKELAALLRPLKDSNPAEYRRAIADLDRVSQRLAETRQRDLTRYEWELKRWQVQSRIDLLAARWQMTNSEELKRQLQEALDERYTLNLQIQRLERDRLSERLQKLDAQLQSAEGKRAETVERELRNFVAKNRTAPKPAASKSSGEKKPSEKKTSDKKTTEKQNSEKNTEKPNSAKPSSAKQNTAQQYNSKPTTEKKNREKESK